MDKKNGSCDKATSNSEYYYSLYSDQHDALRVFLNHWNYKENISALCHACAMPLCKKPFHLSS